MCERDNFGVSRVLAVVPPEGMSVVGNIWAPRAYFEAVAARARGDAGRRPRRIYGCSRRS